MTHQILWESKMKGIWEKNKFLIFLKEWYDIVDSFQIWIWINAQLYKVKPYLVYLFITIDKQPINEIKYRMIVATVFYFITTQNLITIGHNWYRLPHLYIPWYGFSQLFWYSHEEDNWKLLIVYLNVTNCLSECWLRIFYENFQK